MPYIFVRTSPNVSRVPNVRRVAKEAYPNTTTYIDSRFQWIPDALQFLQMELCPLTLYSNGYESSRISTPRPPFEVLNKLSALGFSVVKANTVGVTTVWTLQNAMPCITVWTIWNKKKIPNTYIKSSFRWTGDGLQNLESQLGPLKRSADENRRDSLFSTRRLPWEVLNKLEAFGFSVVAENTDKVPTKWTLQGILHQIFVSNEMKMEIVPILREDVAYSCPVAEEANYNTETYIDSSSRWTSTEIRNLETGLGPLTRCANEEDRRDSLLSTRRPPAEVLNMLRVIRFLSVAVNTVGTTTVWTLYRGI